MNKESMQNRFHVKSGDEVVVLSGVHRGRRGKVLRILTRQSRVVVEGVNLVKKATRKSQQNPQGGFVEKEGAFPVSKVMLAARYEASQRRPKAAAPAKA